MKILLILAVILAIGFLCFLPITKHYLTRNQVERELETALVEYQVLSREKFQERVNRIAVDNALDPAGLKISIDHAREAVFVTIQYTSNYKVFFVPVSKVVVVKKGSRSLGI